MIAYETDLEIISFRSNCYIPDAIVRNSASPRHRHHHHKRRPVVVQLISGTTLFNRPSVECPVASEPVVYGNKG